MSRCSVWKGSVEVVEGFVAYMVQNLSMCRGGGGVNPVC